MISVSVSKAPHTRSELSYALLYLNAMDHLSVSFTFHLPDDIIQNADGIAEKFTGLNVNVYMILM